jgi:hypothetical protein
MLEFSLGNLIFRYVAGVSLRTAAILIVFIFIASLEDIL